MAALIGLIKIKLEICQYYIYTGALVLLRSRTSA